MCVKIVAEYKEYVLMETVATQDMQDRVFLFIRYLYPDETRPETRKRPKKWADLCEAKVGEPSRISSISGLVRRYWKNLQLFMDCIFFSISSGKLDFFMVLHVTRIWDKLEAI